MVDKIEQGYGQTGLRRAGRIHHKLIRRVVAENLHAAAQSLTSSELERIPCEAR